MAMDQAQLESIAELSRGAGSRDSGCYFSVRRVARKPVVVALLVEKAEQSLF